jgi:hypothetical protein
MKKLLGILFAAFVGVAVLAPTQSAEAQPALGNYCCDGASNHRYVIGNGPLPIGGSCFCYGQGYSFVCL